jgi:hypothetical protein
MRTLMVVMSMGLVACQRERTSDIDPFFLEQTSVDRVVVSRNLQPNIMLLVDNSSALGDVNDSSSRAAQLKVAAHALLTNGSTFRWGLTTFRATSSRCRLSMMKTRLRRSLRMRTPSTPRFKRSRRAEKSTPSPRFSSRAHSRH